MDSQPTYSEKQGQYLAFIYAYSKLHARPPAEADMQRYFRVTAPSVHQMVLTLEKAQLISRQPGQPRSIVGSSSPKRYPRYNDNSLFSLTIQLIKTFVSRY